MNVAPTSRTARRTHGFNESVIRAMTRVAREHEAVNLAQGFPDFPAPPELKAAACRAIRDDVNQYAITWGSASLRRALARKYRRFYDMEVDPEREITVTCGATEAMAAAMLAVLNPGDGVVVLEPFYENYGPDAILSGARPRFLELQAPSFRLDPGRLAEIVTPATRAVVLNSPNNPTGRVFSREELEGVARVARDRNLLVLTDEIYEHIVYDGVHVPLATLDGMRERTITISGLSKTFSITGWRIGTIVAPPELTDAIRKVHDFLTVGSPAPLQEACAAGLEELDRTYYDGMVREYGERRDILLGALRDAGFRCGQPEGAYYVLADFSELSSLEDDAFAHELAREGGVAAVPGSSFFHGPEGGRGLVRFAFCKRLETLREAGDRLRRFARAGR